MELIDMASVLSFVVRNGLELVQHEYDIIGGAKDRVEELNAWVETLEGFVREYTKERYIPNDHVKVIVKQITRKLYESEDIVEAYMHTVLLHQSRHGVGKVFQALPDLSGLRKVGKDLENQLKSLQNCTGNMQDVTQAARVDENSAGSRPMGGQENRYNVKSSEFIDYADRVNRVIKLLKKESEKKDLQEVPVVTITAMFGMGKTALAKEVLKHPTVRQTFRGAFIEVSDNTTTKVLLDILRAFLEKMEEIEHIRDDVQLAKALKEELKKIDYLIVLDDVRSDKVWNALETAFPKKNGSAVLITRQYYEDPSPYARPLGVPFPLESLTLKEGEALLRKEAGLNTNPADDHYVTKIVEKCQNLPLSILLAAGVLRTMTGQTDRLNSVLQSLDEYVADDPNHTGPIRLSYAMLPFKLKQCFLYLGVFHQGSEIPVWKLLRLWEAEGFIQHGDGRSWETRAEAYLQKLVETKLVTVKEKKLNGHIKTCIIHNAVHSFCKEEAKKDLLFQEIKFDGATIHKLDSAAYRRLCIKPEILPNIKSKDALQNVRSFLCFTSKETPFAPEASSPFSKGFKLLRVLDFKSMTFSRFPDELHSLVLLKYIAIFCYSGILPENVRNLLNLQTLMYETSSKKVTVKADIWKMSLLRHLHTNFSMHLRPSSQSSGSQRLQTLCTVSSESCTAEVFKRMPNLNKLGISGKLGTFLEASDGPCVFAGISEYIKHVQNLKLLNEDIKSIPKVLDPQSFPEKLARLTLTNTELNIQHMTALGKLPFLQVLKLKKTVFQGGKLATVIQDFLALKVLCISATNLEEWISSEKHFPSLECLVLRDCGMLKAIPSGLGKIEHLNKIELYSPEPELEDSARKIEVLKRQTGAPFTLFVPDSKEQANSEACPPPDPKMNSGKMFSWFWSFWTPKTH